MACILLNSEKKLAVFRHGLRCRTNSYNLKKNENGDVGSKDEDEDEDEDENENENENENEDENVNDGL